ncbi:vegetative cell wall protein gp1-like [Triticum urartu]|uniref:vegetative cell wall protein gp1-like n=1 Tax=Triticum urartu TaxID=4572 RepID=UPI0020447C62|nr:vegetative cell wall protein gp1-like [Triticum urartu]
MSWIGRGGPPELAHYAPPERPIRKSTTFSPCLDQNRKHDRDWPSSCRRGQPTTRRRHAQPPPAAASCLHPPPRPASPLPPPLPASTCTFNLFPRLPRNLPHSAGAPVAALPPPQEPAAAPPPPRDLAAAPHPPRDPWWAAGSRPILSVEPCWRPSSSTGCRPPRASGSKPTWLSDAPVSNLRLPSSADVSWMWRSSMCS